MPNLAVDVNSWARSACYPQGSFYPLSDGHSILHRRITKPDFRPCSSCRSRSQAPFCLCARRLISNQSEGTFGRLRYSLGGDRPSQTAHLTLSLVQIHGSKVRIPNKQEWYPNVDSSKSGGLVSQSPTYPVQIYSKFNIRLQ